MESIRNPGRLSLGAIAAMALWFTNGCASLREPATSYSAAPEVADRALSLVGARYRHGGDEPGSGFDCSGLVRWVYRDQPMAAFPRSASEMRHMDAPDVPRNALAAGDLVFFRIDGKVSHVGVYVGDGRFVHAPGRGKPVRIDRLDDPFWTAHYAGAKRPVTVPT